jgi:hypothetical protein
MAAIERLMNRKVEQRVIAGFEPGSAPRRDEEPRPDGHRRPNPQQQRRPQQQQRRPQKGRGPQQQPGRGPQQHGRGPQGSNGPRFNGQQRGPQPRHNGAQPAPQQSGTESQRDEQIREARARMMEEGEAVPPAQQPGRNEHRNNGGRPPQGARPDGRRGGGRGDGNRGGPRGQQRRSPGRGPRQQQWDPRRSEPREPAYASERKPASARPAPVIQHKQRRTIAGFVGALLGRKSEDKPEDK